jgi:putative hydrolases of HD superfamily
MKITNKRLLTILDFIEEIEKLKHIKRINTLSDGSRQESDAEHSWHLAMIVLLLKDELGVKFDVDKAIKIALVHDLVEIYIGDSWPSNAKEKEEKIIIEEREAEKLFSKLPEDLKKEMKGYWREYEDAITIESKIVKGLDKIVYPMHYSMSGKIVYFKEQSTSEERRAYGLPHVQHNKVLAEIFEHYNDKLDNTERHRVEFLN